MLHSKNNIYKSILVLVKGKAFVYMSFLCHPIQPTTW